MYVIVRDPPGRLASQILVQVPVNTWEAYNQWGGGASTTSRPRARRVTFDRPWGKYANSPLWWEIQLVRFLEREGYDVSYQTDIDTDADPGWLLRHRLVMTAGHDEYWTKRSATRSTPRSPPARTSPSSARTPATGRCATRTTGTRSSPQGCRSRSRARSGAEDRDVPAARADATRVHDRRRPASLPPPHQNGPHDYTVAAPAADPWFLNTGFAPGAVITDVVGDEWDALNPWPDACIHPGLTVLFHFAYNSPTGDGDAVRFTAPSGARVFASGAQRFSWGLDTFGTAPYGHAVPASPGLQQFMRNMLDDLTRPAAPVRVYRRADPAGLRIRTGWPADPRIVGRVVFRLHDADPPLQICSGRSKCIVARATTPGTYRYEVMYVDAWGRMSAPRSRPRGRSVSRSSEIRAPQRRPACRRPRARRSHSWWPGSHRRTRRSRRP